MMENVTSDQILILEIYVDIRRNTLKVLFRCLP